MKNLIFLACFCLISCSIKPGESDPAPVPLPNTTTQDSADEDNIQPVNTTGTRGGGDSKVIQFMMYINTIEKFCKNKKIFSDVELKRLSEIIKSLNERLNSRLDSSIVFVDKRPRDEHGNPKQALYDRTQQRIFVHELSWDNNTHWQNISLVLLELMGLLGVEDRYPEVVKIFSSNYSELQELGVFDHSVNKVLSSYSEMSDQSYNALTFYEGRSELSNMNYSGVLKYFQENLGKQQGIQEQIEALPKDSLLQMYSIGVIVLDLSTPAEGKSKLQPTVFKSQSENYLQYASQIHWELSTRLEDEPSIAKVIEGFHQLRTDNSSCSELLSLSRTNLMAQLKAIGFQMSFLKHKDSINHVFLPVYQKSYDEAQVVNPAEFEKHEKLCKTQRDSSFDFDKIKVDYVLPVQTVDLLKLYSLLIKQYYISLDKDLALIESLSKSVQNRNPKD